MPRASVKRREIKRKKLCEQHLPKRKALLEERRQAMIQGDIDKVMEIQKELEKLPRNSSPNRRQRRCSVNGRPKGVLRRFGVCRQVLRKIVMQGEASGTRKSSW